MTSSAGLTQARQSDWQKFGRKQGPTMAFLHWFLGVFQETQDS